MRHRPQLPFPPRFLTAALLATSLFLAGCSRDLPTSPASLGGTFASDRTAQSASGMGAFFPLVIGNRWHALAEDHFVVQPSGGGPPIQDQSIQSDITRELSGTESLFGRVYVLQTETLVETGEGVDPTPTTSWIRYRQDGTGLYEADVDPGQPPADAPSTPATVAPAPRTAGTILPASFLSRLSSNQAAAYERAWTMLRDRAAILRAHLAGLGSRASGPLSNEITRLDYPLHPGARWAIRTDMSFGAVVEGLDNLKVAGGSYPAYRIRIESDFLGAGDTVHIWFGRSGQLQFEYHLSAPATDVDGNIIGVATLDHREAVDEVNLVR